VKRKKRILCVVQLSRTCFNLCGERLSQRAEGEHKSINSEHLGDLQKEFRLFKTREGGNNDIKPFLKYVAWKI